MKVELVNISELKPHPKNPRVHPDSALDKLVRSIQEFGWTNPILVSKDGYILAGHARLKAAERAGIKKVPVIYLPLEGEKAEAYMIADNKLQDETDWDLQKLKDLLEELDTGEFDIEITGFTEAEIEDLMTQFHVEKKADPDGFDADAAADAIVEPVTKRGMIYALGRHRLMCGDATSFEDVEKLMDGKLADMVFTDPPYNVDYSSKNETLNKIDKGNRVQVPIENDKMDSDTFYRFLYDAFANMLAVTIPGGAFYVCHSDAEGINFRTALRDSGWLLKQTIVWVKNNIVIGRQDYQNKHELILYGWKPGASHKWYGGRKKTTVLKDRDGLVVREEGNGVILTFTVGAETVVLKVPSYEIIYDGDDSGTTVWHFDKPLRNAEHPTMKPVALIERAIKNSSKHGQIVLDLFGGSGTTLIAAEKTGRTCYMMELDEKYCDVIVQRWEEFTGQKAVKA